jgi:hypothetical protein
MARGWESKSVEAQQAEASESFAGPKKRLSPEERAKSQCREGLLLSRKHIVEQMAATQNPRHQKMLAEALAELDARLAQPG